MNIGVFGGTFNPPHLGHFIVAERVREELGLGKIILIPSCISPHKQHTVATDPAYRLEMTQLAALGQQFFEASPLEVERGGISYTVDTLEQLAQSYAGDTLHLLVGMDNIPEFGSWKEPERIARLAKIVVMTRPGYTMNELPDGLRNAITVCRVPEIGISSREIRERVSGGKSIHFLVSKPVESYIYYRRLYR
jgi:nicotinate-nucleotide adenylyltransferase